MHPSFRNRPTSKLGDIIHSSPNYVAAPGSAIPTASRAAPTALSRQRTPAVPAIIYVGAQRRHAARDQRQHRRRDVRLRAVVGLPDLSAADGAEPVVASRRTRTAIRSTARRRSATSTTAAPGTRCSSAGMGAGGQGHLRARRHRSDEFQQANARSSCAGSSRRPDMGYMFGQPLLVKTNNGRWSVIVGSGYNVGNAQRPRRPVRARCGDRCAGRQDRHRRGHGGDARTVCPGRARSTSTATASPTSSTPAISTATCGSSTCVSTLAGQWTSASAACRCSRRAGQPITVRPDVTKFTAGGYLVAFGTGRYVDAQRQLDDRRRRRSTAFATPAPPWPDSRSWCSRAIVGTARTGSDGNTYRFTTHAVGRRTIDTRCRRQRHLDVGLRRRQEGLVHQPAGVRRARRRPMRAFRAGRACSTRSFPVPTPAASAARAG